MDLDKLKQTLVIPDNIKKENIKTYLIYENIDSMLSNMDDIRPNFFSKLKLSFKLMSAHSNFSDLYNDILSKSKSETELKELLYILNKKIEKKFSIDKLQEQAINSISQDSSFYISIGNTDENINFINATLDNDILTFDWNYNRKELSDKDSVNSFKNIILEHKNELFEFTNNQKNIDKKELRNLILKGKMKNSFQGSIDNMKISIYPELSLQNSTLNNSYFKLKNDVISFLEKNLEKAKDIK